MTVSREGARTPMPWRAGAPALGFSTAKPWLPVGADHAELAIDRQEADPASALALTRRLVALRNDSDVLRLGDLTVIHADDHLLAFERHHGGRTLLCCFNLSADPVIWKEPYPARVLERVGKIEGNLFDPYSGYIAEKEG
jgi:alpha-glucosidase